MCHVTHFRQSVRNQHDEWNTDRGIR